MTALATEEVNLQREEIKVRKRLVRLEAPLRVTQNQRSLDYCRLKRAQVTLRENFVGNTSFFLSGASYIVRREHVPDEWNSLNPKGHK